tara:strand:- start:125 stop:364 length:240 start_codon:yes stop_codon:yes gene_type:complete
VKTVKQNRTEKINKLLKLLSDLKIRAPLNKIKNTAAFWVLTEASKKIKIIEGIHFLSIIVINRKDCTIKINISLNPVVL